MLPSRYKILNRKHNENKATKRAQSAFKSTSDIVTYDYRSTRAISIIVSTVTGVTVRELSIRLQSVTCRVARALFSARPMRQPFVATMRLPPTNLPLSSSLKPSHLSLLTGHGPQRWTIQPYKRWNKPVTRCPRLWKLYAREVERCHLPIFCLGCFQFCESFRLQLYSLKKTPFLRK